MAITTTEPIPLTCVLEEQSAAHARSVGRLRRAGADRSRLIDDLVDVGLRLYESAQDAVGRWHAEVERGTSVPARAAAFHL